MDRLEQERLSPTFLKPTALFTTLKEVQERFPEAYAFIHPVRMIDTHNFYSTTRARAAMMGRSMRVFIEFPVTTLGRLFMLYRVVKFPHYIRDRNVSVHIQPPFPYLALTDDGQNYHNMEDRELATCYGPPTNFICKPTRPIHTALAPSCSISLHKKITTKPLTVFVREEGDNKWTYSLSEKKNVLITCLQHNETSKRVFTLSGSGILTLNKSCHGQVEDHILLPHDEEIFPIHDLGDRFEVFALLRIPEEKADEIYLYPSLTDQQIKEMKLLDDVDLDTNNLRVHVERVKFHETQQMQTNWLLVITGILGLIIVVAVLYRGITKLKRRGTYHVKEEEKPTHQGD